MYKFSLFYQTTQRIDEKEMDANMGRTKRGNANAQRNNNRRNQFELSEDLVEFNTDKKSMKSANANKE